MNSVKEMKQKIKGKRMNKYLDILSKNVKRLYYVNIYTLKNRIDANQNK